MTKDVFYKAMMRSDKGGKTYKEALCAPDPTIQPEPLNLGTDDTPPPELLSQEVRNAIALYPDLQEKRQQECSNHRTITLISHASKIAL